MKKAIRATELSTHNIKVLSLSIGITTNHKSLLKEFCDFTSALALPANGEPPAVRFRVMKKRKYTDIEKDGRTIYHRAEDSLLRPLLVHQIRDCCCEQVRDYLIFHSAALVKNGCAILLPGESGSGKSTLTLGLMNYGYRYLTDEVSVIHHETLEVVPYQRHIFAWTWSRPLRQEVVKDFSVYRFRHDDGTTTKRWTYFIPQDGAIMPKDTRWRVDRIIFPRYTTKGKTELKPLAPAQAVIGLMQNGWNQKLFPDGGLKICIELAQRARCYTLEMRNLDSACELIEDLQGQGC